MAILKLESFDRYASLNSTSPALTESWSPVGSSVSSAIVKGRFGTGKALNIGNPSGSWNMHFGVGGNLSALAFGIAFQCDAISYDMGLGANGTPIFNFNDSAQAIQLQLCADANGNLIIRRGSATQIGSGNGNRKLMSSTYHYIECEIVVSDTVGVFKAWIDGVQVIDLTNIDTLQTANANISTISIPMFSTQEAEYYYDDLYITDGARLGEIRIVSLSPTADTADKDWVPNSGVTNYTQVDDVVSDLEATYVQGSVVGDLDLYTFAALPASMDNIIAVAPLHYSRKTDAGVRSTRGVIKSGSDIANGPATPETSAYSTKQFIQTVDPQGGGAWTQARVNGMQVGVEITA